MSKLKLKLKFEEPSLLEDGINIDDSLINNKRFNQATFDNNADYINFENCVFENCQFKKNLSHAVFYNCRFTKCDFSNIVLDKCGFHACLIESSRLMGTVMYFSNLNNTQMVANKMTLIEFAESKFNNLTLKENDLKTALFNKVVIKDILLENNDFSETSFNETSLKNVDLRSCKIEEIDISSQDIEGAIVDQVQAIELINILHLIIK